MNDENVEDDTYEKYEDDETSSEINEDDGDDDEDQLYHDTLPFKRRGISRDINLEKVWQVNGKRPLTIAFDNVEHKMQQIGNKVKYFTLLVGNQDRFTVPPCYLSWTEVPEQQRAQLRSIIESYFDLQGDRSPDEYRPVCADVDHLAADRYRDYKLKAHSHLKAYGPSRPYGELSAED
ncbi:Uncharacterized protein Adt_03400 [Abeliophyllum distichum]|uniref:Uncharacterized protein n=1 Tax=Abeliophyllum distichum TaxID=126358 RepID=A0ABD1VYN8_9LAMI